jgi:arginine decarboxylase
MTPDRDQQATPYLDALVAHADAVPGRYNVPTHKGGALASPRLLSALGERALEMDIPPLVAGIDAGADPTPFEQAQRLAARAWSARRTWFLVNGASHANHAACVALAHRGAEVVVQRNVHSSTIDGAIVAGLRPTFVAPELDARLGVAHCVTPAALAAALDSAADPAGVIVVSPSYYGTAADVRALVEVAHARDVPIVVDEAWGAHFAHHDALPRDAISAGADLVVSSTHKMLGSLTQSAMLHLGWGDLLDGAAVDQAVGLLESTSPSALLAGSLDAARHHAATHGHALIESSLGALARIRARARELPGCDVLDDKLIGSMGIAGVDPFRLCIDVSGTGVSGFALQALLREIGDVYIELVSASVLVAIFGMGDNVADGDRLIDSLEKAIAVARDEPAAHPIAVAVPPPAGPLVLSPRDAFFASHRRVELAEAAGCIAAETLAVYPPGIPNALPGERLTADVVEYVAGAARTGAFVRGASDRSLRTVKVVDTTTRSAGSG